MVRIHPLHEHRPLLTPWSFRTWGCRKASSVILLFGQISRNGPFLFGFLENEAMGAVTHYIFHIKIHSRITGEIDLLCVFISFFSIVLIFKKNP
jgi:hypothetical protein